MTRAQHKVDYNEEVNDFLKLYKKDLELQANKLARLYRIDLHELQSRTAVTVWTKWPDALCTLPCNEKYKYTLRILFNHARNLSRNERRSENACELFPGEELEGLAYPANTWRDVTADDASSKNELFAIYRAISMLNGRCREVMTLIALGLENIEIRQELGITETNLTSIKARACKSLQEILELEGKSGGGEPR